MITCAIIFFIGIYIMSLRLWPNNYENKDYISKEEKRLLRNASRNFTDGHFAVGIDPMGMNKPDYKMGFYISPNEGLVTFSIFLASSTLFSSKELSKV